MELQSGTKKSAWDLIGQDNHWEVPKRPRINARTPPWNLSLNALQPLLTSSWISLSPEKWTLSSALDHTQPAWYHEKKKSHLVFTSFYSLTLVYFLSVSSCAKTCVCPIRQAQDSAKPANAHFHDSWTLSQSATSENPFLKRRRTKGNPLNTKATQVQIPDFAVTGVILKIDFSLIEKLNASGKSVIDGCSGLCNCTYCCKRGISNSHSLNLILSSLSLFLQRVNVWMLVFM